MWFFLAVLACAGCGLLAWRWWLDALPSVTRKEWTELVDRMDATEEAARKAGNTVAALSMARASR